MATSYLSFLPDSMLSFPMHHPGILNIPHHANATTCHVTDHLTRTHKEQLRIFHEVRGVEQALMMQITNAINKMYIMSFKNRITGQYTGNILDVLNYLQDHQYGKILHSQLLAFAEQQEEEVTIFIFDPLTPAIKMYSTKSRTSWTMVN